MKGRIEEIAKLLYGKKYDDLTAMQHAEVWDYWESHEEVKEKEDKE